MLCFGDILIISVIVRHDGGDVGGWCGRVLHSTDYGSSGDGFCKSGYLSVHCASKQQVILREEAAHD